MDSVVICFFHRKTFYLSADKKDTIRILQNVSSGFRSKKQPTFYTHTYMYKRIFSGIPMTSPHFTLSWGYCKKKLPLVSPQIWVSIWSPSCHKGTSPVRATKESNIMSLLKRYCIRWCFGFCHLIESDFNLRAQVPYLMIFYLSFCLFVWSRVLNFPSFHHKSEYDMIAVMS